MMRCKLCGSSSIEILYKGLIRNGGLGQYTNTDVEIYRCKECNVIWHEDILEDIKKYYESKEYRNSIEGTSEEDTFYRIHDKETLEKFRYTGTTVFRNKVVADIGCGAGAFLDYLKGVAKEIIAIEPSETYRQILERKGYHTYAYAREILRERKNIVEVCTSFDVLEHVADPRQFIREIYDLLAVNGIAMIGTPTDAPVMRELLGEIYEKKVLFSTQHLWIFSEKNLKLMAREGGFQKPEIKYFQRYGLGNMLGWVREKEPRSEIKADIITETLNQVWISECERRGLSDYIVLYLKKI